MNDRPHYPWKEGDALFADELNAAISQAASGTSGSSEVNVLNFGAKGDGVTDDFLAICAARDSKPSGQTATLLFPGNRAYYLSGVVNPNGRVLLTRFEGGASLIGPGGIFNNNGATGQWVGQSFQETFNGPVQLGNAGVIARRTDIYNDTTSFGQGTRTAYYTKATAAGNDIAHTDIMGVQATSTPGVSSFLAYTNDWVIHVSPKDTAGQWWSLGLLVNPVHRGDDLGWTSTPHTRARYTAGIAVAPDTSDFNIPPAGAVTGNILFAYAVDRANNHADGHIAQSYNGLLIQQNAIAPNGRGIYIGGYAASTGVPASPLPYAPLQANDAWQYGIDFNGATFTGAAFRSPGFTVSNVGRVTAASGIYLNDNLASSPTDLTKGIDFYAGQYGINIQGFTMNLVVGGVAMGVLNSSLNGMFSAGMLGINGVTGPTWTTGTAAPSSTQPPGSLYSRTGTWAAGTTLYVSKGGGAWTAVAGV